jgi:hypothetical protein
VVLPRFVLVAIALVWLIVGVWGLVDPVGLAAVPAMTVEGDGGPLEIRAMYGGLGVGLSAYLLWCAASPARMRTGLTCAILTLGGIAVTRTVFWVLTPDQPIVHIVFAVLELASTGFALIAWWQARPAGIANTPVG